MSISRRTFITGSTAAAAAIAAGTTSSHGKTAAQEKPAIKLKQGATVLLQGDSITVT